MFKRSSIPKIIWPVAWFICFFISSRLYGQTDSLKFITPGVVLTYRVSYGPFRIGTVKYEMLGIEKYKGRSVIRSRMYLDSNPKFIFVTLHSIFETLTDSLGFSLWLNSIEETEGDKILSTYMYDPDDSKMRIEERYLKRKWDYKLDSLHIPEPYYDGLSLIYVARRDIRKRYQQKFPTVADDKIRESVIHFEAFEDTVHLKAINFTLDAFRISGKVNLGARAMAGLAGKFKGWFSVDPTATPLKAEMGIFIGKIVLELESINRPNWPE